MTRQQAMSVPCVYIVIANFRALILIFLGMRAYGHTASLIPLIDSLQETTRWVTPNYLKQRNTWRVTLTVPAINVTRHIEFIVSGESKM